ncbi:MAG: replication initiation protein [Caldisericota bacterium]|nr:replication initiation protein [Caldisericota bacterium]
MKDKPLHPDTIIQPNKVTMMRYAITALEENLFTLVMDSFKNELYNGKLMDRNLWGEPVLNLDLKEIAPTLLPADAFKRLKKIKRREFGYTYISPKNGQEVEVDGVLFPTVLKSGNYVQVKVNTDALPFLLWIDGPEPGKTYYNKLSSMTLSGGHSKRLYKMLCSWKSKGAWRIKIDEFKQKFKVTHNLSNLKRLVLEPAKEEMYNNKNSDIWFEYSTETSEELKQQGGKGRKPHDQLVFKIHTRYKTDDERLEELRKGIAFELFNEILLFLQSCLGKTSEKALEITGACTDEGDRFCNQRYKDLKGLREKAESKPQAFNFFMKGAEKQSDNDIFQLRYKDCKTKTKKK